MAREEIQRHDLTFLFDTLQDLLPDLKKKRELYQDLNDFYDGLDDVVAGNRGRLTEKIPIVVTGETSAGKSSVLNVILGHNILPSAHIHSTSAIIKLQKGDKLKVKPTEGDEIILDAHDESSAAQAVMEVLKKHAIAPKKRGKAVGETSLPVCTSVDVFWPYDSSFLKDGMLLVDTPGFGQTQDMTTLIMEYLPNAMAFIYVINSSNAGGVQQDRLQQIIEAQLKWCRKRKLDLLEPKRAIFICNKWDQVPAEEDEDVWEDTIYGLKIWPGFQEKQLVRFSAKQVEESLKRQKKENTGQAADDDDNAQKQFKKLQTMVSALINASFDGRFTVTARWLRLFCKDLHDRILLRLRTASETKKQKEKLRNEFEANKQRMKIRADQDEKDLKKIFKTKCAALAEEIHAYLNKEEIKKELVDWSNEDTDISGIPDLDLDAAKELIMSRIMKKIMDYDNEHKIFERAQIELDSILREKAGALLKEVEISRYVPEADEIKGVPKTISNASTSLIADVISATRGEKIVATLLLPLILVWSLITFVVFLPGIIARLAGKKWRKRKYMNFLSEVVLESMKVDNVKLEVEDVFGYYPKWINEVYKETIPRYLVSLSAQYETICKSEEDQAEIVKNCHDLSVLVTPLFKDLGLFNLMYIGNIPGTSVHIAPNVTVSSSNHRGFSTTCKGWFETENGARQAVIVKSINTPLMLRAGNPFDKRVARLFVCSIEYLKSHEYTHMVRLLGTSIDPNEFSPRLVLEECDMNVKDYLQQNEELICGNSENDENDHSCAVMKYCEIANGLLEGLGHIHSDNCVHGNLKMTNVLIKDGDVKLTDGWYIAAESDDTKGVFPTTKYLAPEVQNGDRYTRASDIFSLGILLWELWFAEEVGTEGASPEDMQKEMYTPQMMLIPFEESIHLPVALQEIIEKCLNQDSSQRPSLDVIKMHVLRLKGSAA